ncbi:MAG: stage II sporulation protein M [Aggregatilineales bacterium]
MATLETPATAASITGVRTAQEARIGEHTLAESIRNALVITRREVRDSFRDWRIMGPIFILTLVFPALAQGATGLFIHFFEENGASPLVNNLLPLLPMIVGFFPISISLVIALETFVGEKERRSLEPLLSTPLTNAELYVGKTLAAMIPPLLASYLGISIYVGGLIFGAQQWRPEVDLIVQIVVLTTAQALVMVTGAVVVSSQTTSTRAANLLASFIIVPISMLVMLESFIMITNNRYVLWYIVGGLITVDLVLFVTGARMFNREELLGRQMDELNFRWAGRLFWRSFRGTSLGVTNVRSWYERNIFPALRRLRIPMIVVAVSMIGAFIFGFAIAQARLDLQFSDLSASRVTALQNFVTAVNLGSPPQGIFDLALQYTRILLVAVIMATFSFGVMGVVLVMIPIGILGFLLGQPVIGQVGIPQFLAAIVPQLLIQVPAVIIGAAAALQLGSVVLRRQSDKTVGQAWLGALADCAAIWLGVVLPMLIVAGVVAVFITPLIVKVVTSGG